jgi:HlyD family secretion protein
VVCWNEIEETMKLKLSRKQILLIAMSFVAVIAVVGFTLWGRSAGNEEYMTAKIEKGTIRNTVSATGTLQAVTTVQVGSQVSGTISALFADFNSNVRKGQIVAQLDPAIFQAQVASARANLDSARANVVDSQAKVLAAKSTVQNLRAGVSSSGANLAALKAQRDDAQSFLTRQEALAAAGLIAARELETARTALQAADARYNQAMAQLDQARLSEQSSAGSGIAQAEAQVKQAQAQVQQSQAALQLAEVNLSHTTIRSPIDGVVVSRNVDVGQTVAASLSAPTLFTIANDLTQMQVIANIDQADIGVINQSNKINFTVDAFPGSNFSGTISQIRLNPQNVQNVVTYNVVIDVKNPDLKLKPGMTSNLTMTIAERSDVLKVPNAALRFRPQGMTQEQIRELMRGAFGGRSGGDRPQGDQARGQQTPGGEGRPAGAASPAGAPSPAAGGNPEGGRRGGGGGGGGGGASTAILPGQNRIVWILGPDKKPQPKRIKLGITDGTATEIVEGELKEGDTVIVGQSVTPTGSPQAGQQRAPGFGGGMGGGGRR